MNVVPRFNLGLPKHYTPVVFAFFMSGIMAMLMCLVEEAMHDTAQDSAETLAKVRAIFTKYT